MLYSASRHVYTYKILNIFSPFDVTWSKWCWTGLNPFCFTIQTIARASESLTITNTLEMTLAPCKFLAPSFTVVSSHKDIYLSLTRRYIYSLWILCPCQRNCWDLLLPPVEKCVLPNSSKRGYSPVELIITRVLNWFSSGIWQWCRLRQVLVLRYCAFIWLLVILAQILLSHFVTLGL